MSTGPIQCRSIGCSFATLLRWMAGGLCLTVGLLLASTLWLIVIGVPLALFGVALMATDQA